LAGRTTILLLTLAYPVAVFFALTYWNLSGLGAVLVAIGIARLALDRRQPGVSRFGGLLLIGTGALLLWLQAEVVARVYPVLVNIGMAAWFAWSLVHPPTVIEAIARLQDPHLPPYAVTYTRKVTWVWLAFFIGNGLVAGYTTLYATLTTWTWYNGVVAYVLMGGLFCVEYLIRRTVRARQEADIG